MENDTAILACEVSNADCKITWYKDDKEITASKKFKMVNEDTVKKLIIKKVLPEDAGNYIGKTKGVKSSAKLFVKGNDYYDTTLNMCIWAYGNFLKFLL